MALVWFGYGFNIVLVWFRYGISILYGMVLVWLGGFGMVLMWFRYDNFSVSVWLVVMFV